MSDKSASHAALDQLLQEHAELSDRFIVLTGESNTQLPGLVSARLKSLEDACLQIVSELLGTKKG